MTGSQYKNIVEWTLYSDNSLAKSESIDVAKKIFKNLGVAFPHGDYDKIIEILSTKTYLGWRKCHSDEVQRFADIGIPGFGIDSERIIIIIPGEDINDFAYFPDHDKIRSVYVKNTSELDKEKDANLKYFVYSYSYKFKD